MNIKTVVLAALLSEGQAVKVDAKAASGLAVQAQVQTTTQATAQVAAATQSTIQAASQATTQAKTTSKSDAKDKDFFEAPFENMLAQQSSFNQMNMMNMVGSQDIGLQTKNFLDRANAVANKGADTVTSAIKALPVDDAKKDVMIDVLKKPIEKV